MGPDSSDCPSVEIVLLVPAGFLPYLGAVGGSVPPRPAA
jgi:hypothetical protein